MVLIAVNAISDSDTANQSELDRYIWFNTEGMYDLNVPNDEIHELITNGLQHENQEIVGCTLAAMGLHIGGTFEARKQGKEVDLNRDLRHKKEWYDTLINMWDDNWSGVLPEETFPDDLVDRMKHNTGCVYMLPTWIGLPQILAYMYPQDEKVYKIIWDAYPIPQPIRGGKITDETNPLPLLRALFDGGFNHEKDQQFRIDILLNRETSYPTAQFAARSLGNFRSDEGLKALADRLTKSDYKYGTPKLEFVEAITKYEAQAQPYIPLLKKSLRNIPRVGSFDPELYATLKERLVHFEEKYGEKSLEADEPEQPTR
ncbi:MAG: hypothetical protein F4039_02400 [Gammaproteobacteria bacterium]|nr:hypothetical protein [Gammaproteobacteria bacterium]MYF53835.1 hypothetical protein [Gammaproteobacteria bacterium]MYK42925.1 hypothetical protein [Gammaproteobacteria bacterium]